MLHPAEVGLTLVVAVTKESGDTGGDNAAGWWWSPALVAMAWRAAEG